MSKDALDPSTSPDLLDKPRGAAVRKLNIRPLQLLGILAVLVIIALVYSLQGRGGGDAGPVENPESGVAADRMAQELVANQPLGVIGERTPVALPATDPPTHAGDENPLRVAPRPSLGEDVSHIPSVPTAPPSDLEIELRQRHIDLLWARHDRLQKAIEATTRVDFETDDATAGGASGAVSGYPPGGELAASWPDTPADAMSVGAQGLSPDPNKQASKKAFLAGTPASEALAHRRQPPPSPYEVKTGTVIPAVMIGGINSDLPGVLIAQVSQHVWDTATGGHLLIPQGTRLYGIYDSEVAYGQKRVLVAWTRLIFPDASTLELAGMPGADQAGYGGFKDRVDRHLFRILGSAVLLSVIGAGFHLSQPDADRANPTPQQEAAAQLAQELSQVSREQIRKEMDVQPTLVIRPGYRFNVMVTQDMTLEPYGVGGMLGRR